MGQGVTLTGLIERIGHVSVKALQVSASNLINITDIVPPEQAISLLDRPHFDQQHSIAQIDLAPIPIPPPAFSWADHGGKMSFGLLFATKAIVTVIIIIICIFWHKPNDLFTWLKA